MRLVSIASGSSGNCIYVGTDTTHILVDAGVSGKRIQAGLNDCGLSGEDVDALLVTHEHIDHIGGLGVLSRRFGYPIYTTDGTYAGINCTKSVGDISNSEYNRVNYREKFTIGDIDIFPVRISHDACEPVAYIFENNNKRIAICTDLGTYDEKIVKDLQKLDALFIEANHDINMLQVGPYPYHLKQRILSDRGHLSNENSGRLLSKVLHDNMKYVMLAHLSKENNMPELAYETVKLEITMSDTKYEGNDFPIYVAKRDTVSTEIIV